LSTGPEQEGPAGEAPLSADGQGKQHEPARTDVEVALNRAPDSLLCLDRELRVQSLNQAAEQFFEITSATALNQPLRDLAPWAWRGEFPLQHHQVISSGTAAHFVQEFPERQLRLEAWLAPSHDAGLCGWYRAAAPQPAEMARPEQFVRSALDGFWILDNAGNFLEVDDNYCRLTGFSREQLLTMSLQDLQPADQEQSAWQAIQTAAGQADRTRIRQRHHDGHTLVLEASAQPLPGAARYQVVLRDVTETSRLQEAIHECERRYRLVAGKMRDVFYQTDMAGTLLNVSPSGAALFALEDERTLIGKHLVMDGILLPEEVAEFFRIITTQGEVREHEMKLRTTDNRLLDITTNSRFVVDENGTPVGVEGVFRDVTRRKEAEREKERLASQLRQSQKLESLGRLAGGVAHDFNNLLTVINGRCDFLLSKMRLTDPMRESLMDVRLAGDRAAALTGQMLAFSREQILAPAPIDLNRVIREALRMLQRMVGEDVVIESDLCEGEAVVMAATGLLHQVLMNLIVNARDAMPGGGNIVVRTRFVDSHGAQCVQLKVTDTGCGMDAALSQKIFDPFFTTKAVGKGTGLGLSTVYGIVSQLGGSIEVDSAPGAGTTFRILLPRTDHLPKVTDPTAHEAPPPPGSETIMVVEDQGEVRKLVVAILRDLGYQVLQAASAEEALRIGAESSAGVQLLLTDVVMPGMTGRELANRWRQLQPQSKILFMTGYTSEDLERSGLPEGMELILKPFRPGQVAKQVRAMLDRPSAG
jgi:PAS domain S-box-containing protein